MLQYNEDYFCVESMNKNKGGETVDMPRKGKEHFSLVEEQVGQKNCFSYAWANDTTYYQLQTKLLHCGWSCTRFELRYLPSNPVIALNHALFVFVSLVQ